MEILVFKEIQAQVFKVIRVRRALMVIPEFREIQEPEFRVILELLA